MKPLLWDAINPFTGTPFTWDDPNLRWGDPAYYLEPGDPGFVPYPGQLLSTPATSKSKSKRHTPMPKSDYLKRRDDEFSAQLTTFQNNIGSHTATFGLSPAQVSGQAADAAYFAYILASQQVCSQCSQQWTAWKDIIRGGGAPPATGAPADAPMPAAVPIVAPGVEARFRKLAQSIKAHAAYNPAIGEALGIEGAAHTGPDFAVFKPEFDIVLTGGQVLVRWTWQGQSAFLDMIEILVDRGGGAGFVFLAQDTTPGYVDATPLPATAQKWSYKAIFRVGDQRIGQWSDVVSITVGG
ncbi:MAG: hypothetical protein K1X78_03295 [Verrucomicrobiaceae bacterium]|nr:hypothetical protein [Verrucomicrobiaceae bacterium]